MKTDWPLDGVGKRPQTDELAWNEYARFGSEECENSSPLWVAGAIPGAPADYVAAKRQQSRYTPRRMPSGVLHGGRAA